MLEHTPSKFRHPVDSACPSFTLVFDGGNQGLPILRLRENPTSAATPADGARVNKGATLSQASHLNVLLTNKTLPVLIFG